LTNRLARSPSLFSPYDDFVQAANLYRRVVIDADRDHLIANIVSHLGNAVKRIQYRQAAIFCRADEDYGHRVAEGSGLDVNQVRRLAGMSTEEKWRWSSLR